MTVCVGEDRKEAAPRRPGLAPRPGCKWAFLFLSLILAAQSLFCSTARNAPLDSKEAIKLLAFACDEGTRESIEPWGASGASRGCYRDDRPEGRFIFWEEGYLNLEGFYRQGKKAGTWTVFNGDGSTFVEIFFEDGVKKGKKYH